MPLYTYKCEECEHVFEVRQKMTADPLTECPNCQGAIRRLVNAVGIVFKGSGFYVTDTRNGKSAVTATSGKSDSNSSSSSGNNGKSDASSASESSSTSSNSSETAKSSNSEGKNSTVSSSNGAKSSD